MRADALLAFERRGHCTMRGALPSEAVRAVVPEIDALFRKRERDALEQKVRVLLGDGELARARSEGAGGTRALKRLLEGLPDGSVPFLQLFHLSRAIPALDALLRSPALAGTAARLSAQTEGYSPADLAALVREAALAALEEDMDATAVHPRHFEAALRRVWPSLRDIPPELERVYATFARGLAGSAGKSL